VFAIINLKDKFMKTSGKEFNFFVGIDVSKLTLDVTILKPQSGKLHHKVIDNDARGYLRLRNWLVSEHGVEFNRALICMEHTGLYTRSLEQFLHTNNVYVWKESSLHIKKSLGLTRGKSDKIDSMRIAEYAYRFFDKADINGYCPTSVQALRDLLTTRERLNKALKSIRVSINELKKVAIKEAVVLETYQLSAIRGLKESIREVEEAMFETVERDSQLSKQCEMAISIPGVGKILAIKLMVYTQVFTRFESVRQLACYCGVAPFEHRSGTSINGKTGVSKFANMDLKSTLHLASLSAIQHNSDLKAYYHRKVSEGKSKMCVINAVRNKLLSRIIAVVNRQTPYVVLAQA
jgi:transposase